MIVEILFWAAVAVAVSYAAALIAGPFLRRRRERMERFEALLDDVRTEPWRIPELGTGDHWIWCGVAPHDGRCHTRSCRYSRTHSGPCQLYSGSTIR